MRLFIMPAVYPNQFAPGAGSFIYEQCLALSKSGHEVVVLDASTYDYHHWADSACAVLEKNVDEVGVRYTLHTRGLMTSRLPHLATWSYGRKLHKLFCQAVSDCGKPDVIIAHFSLSAGFVAVELAEQNQIPCIIIEHYSLFLNQQLHPYTQKQLTNAVRKSSAFICVSHSLKKMVEQHTGIREKVVVIPNMVHDRFSYVPPQNQDPFVFFSAGNLNENKRFELLIEAFCKAFTAEDNASLRIAGTGEDRQKLEGLIEKHNRSAQIILLGLVSREDMVAEYQNCHCFALLSRHETFGIVYREAMAVGRPILATKNGGVEENWEHTNGILLDSDDVNAASEGLLSVYHHFGEYDCAAISEKCLSLYGEKIVLQQMEGVLNDVCSASHIAKI